MYLAFALAPQLLTYLLTYPSSYVLAGISINTRLSQSAGSAPQLAGFDFGDAARMAAEFAPILGGPPAGQRRH